jgi:Tol biopolymer transport system component
VRRPHAIAAALLTLLAVAGPSGAAVAGPSGAAVAGPSGAAVAGRAGAAGAAGRREHLVHGTVRRLCDPVRMRKWPGGPSVGRVASGRDVRRYHFQGPWALGVTTRRPLRRGYVLVAAFCPPSARGRRAATVARALAAKPPHGRPGTPLARAQLLRVCTPVVYVRDRPLNRAIGLLYVGDVFRATRRARNPWLGGMANGHARRRGWVPRSALCQGLDRRVPGYVTAVGPAASTVLAPPAVARCGTLVSDRRMLEVGALGAGEVRVELHDHTGRLVSSAHFGHGRAGRWRYAPAGPYRCGERYGVVYEAGGARMRFSVRVAARGATGAGAAPASGSAVAPLASRASAMAVATGTSAGSGAAAAAASATPAPGCRSRPQRKFAHGGNGPVDHRFHARPAISADGRYVAYDLPAAGIVPGDRNGVRDVFERDAVHGRTRLVSAALHGGVGNATSRAAAISADGRFVAFESSATDLVAGDRDGVRDVFVRDLRAGTTRRVAAGRTPALSGDGRFVAFESPAGIDVADLRTGAIDRIAPHAYRPALSADGRYVAYESRDALTPGDANHGWDVFRTDRVTGATVLLSAGPDGHSGHGTSLSAVLSADGSVAAFQSDAPLTKGDRTGLRDVFVRDVATGRTVLASANRCGLPGNGYSRYPSISADGRRVAFDSHATDLVAGTPRGEGQVYLRDLAAHRTRLLSATTAGRASSRTSFSPALAARAAIVAFPSFAYDLGPRDANHRVDIYRRDVARGRTQRLSLP